MVKNMGDNLTYISLFSSAGVGCFAFKKDGFDCIATNEIIKRRLDVQRFNNKCKLDSGYICGDITKDETKKLIIDEVDKWKQFGIKDVDVVIATPPCQGMSVANLKKKKSDLKRNSLVLESINMIVKIKPKFFVFENVSAFMNTACIDNDGSIKPISDAIYSNLGDNYLFEARVLNFKNYGSFSSRTRTLVIGVRKDLIEYITPSLLFPDYRDAKTLREVIGNLPRLTKIGEISRSDIYHGFRKYSPEMRQWIHGLKEGQSAFENTTPDTYPHHFVNGVYIKNVKKNGDKYTRQCWDKVAPCIHTRNDQLASQNTIHPEDDRVFSIRELMLMMSIPKDFKWSRYDLEELNSFTEIEKQIYLKKEEINIRQSIGEAVPTGVFLGIADKIKSFLNKEKISDSAINNIVKKNNLEKEENIISFLKKNKLKYDLSSLCRIIELSNSRRNETESFYTDFFLIEEIIKKLPDFDNKQEISILEPSVGAGNFLPFIFSKYGDKSISIDLVDVDNSAISSLKEIISLYKRENVKINFINDLVIGNPPFSKLSSNSSKFKEYISNPLVINKKSRNTSSYFLEKAISLGSFVSLIMPKNLLNTPEYEETREFLKMKKVNALIDFGERGFKGVLVETICICVSNDKPNFTNVISITKKINLNQSQKYIMDENLPYWIIYRNKEFDSLFENMDFNIFSVFRDRQIVSKMVEKNCFVGSIRVVKSRNISDDGTKLLTIPNYDDFISESDAKGLEVYKFYDDENVYLMPNLTYKTRLMKKSGHFITNGSVAILTLKNNIKFSLQDALFISSKKYRDFMQIARNFQTRSLNIDNNSVFFVGRLKNE